jgi:hypothetical protein
MSSLEPTVSLNFPLGPATVPGSGTKSINQCLLDTWLQGSPYIIEHLLNWFYETESCYAVQSGPKFSYLSLPSAGVIDMCRNIQQNILLFIHMLKFPIQCYRSNSWQWRQSNYVTSMFWGTMKRDSPNSDFTEGFKVI